MKELRRQMRSAVPRWKWGSIDQHIKSFRRRLEIKLEGLVPENLHDELDEILDDLEYSYHQPAALPLPPPSPQTQQNYKIGLNCTVCNTEQDHVYRIGTSWKTNSHGCYECGCHSYELLQEKGVKKWKKNKRTEQKFNL